MNLLTYIVLVGGGGALGALARAGVGWAFVERFGTGAIGTLTVNIVGCLLFGAAKAAVDRLGWGTESGRLFLFTGFLGAFTTFSSFEADIFALWTEDLRIWSAAYLAASVIGGLFAFVVGYLVVSKLSS